MTDPAVAYLPGDTYAPYNRGTTDDIWMKSPNGSATLGLVWPGRSLLVYFEFPSDHSFNQV